MRNLSCYAPKRSEQNGISPSFLASSHQPLSELKRGRESLCSCRELWPTILFRLKIVVRVGICSHKNGTLLNTQRRRRRFFKRISFPCVARKKLCVLWSRYKSFQLSYDMATIFPLLVMIKHSVWKSLNKSHLLQYVLVFRKPLRHARPPVFARYARE